MIAEQKRGKHIPALLARPKLSFRQSYYLNAYREIASSRPTSQGVGMPIPVTEIESYCRLFRIIEVEESAELLMHIQALDNVFMEHQRSKRPGAERPKTREEKPRTRMVGRQMMAV